MSNLQVKSIEEGLYRQLKDLAARENRSISQQVLFLVRNHLARGGGRSLEPTPADVLLELAGSWQDERTAGEIVAQIRSSRRSRQAHVDRL